MAAIGAFLAEMFVLYLISIIGFIAKKKGALSKEANKVITDLILYLTLPALIIYSLDIPFSVDLIVEFFWLLSMSIYVLGLSCVVALMLRKRSTLSNDQKTVYESLIIFGNQGFIGFAIIFILFSQQGIVYLTMFNIFYLIVIWTYGIFLFTKTKELIDFKKIFLNPGIVATVIGLIILFTPMFLPEFISKTLQYIGQMTVPLSMILIGSLVAHLTITDMINVIKNRYLWLVALFKLLIFPLTILLFIVFSVPFSLIVIAVIVAGMPSAPTISLYAQKYGGDAFFAASGVFLTTVLCLLTVPLLYFLLILLQDAGLIA